MTFVAFPKYQICRKIVHLIFTFNILQSFMAIQAFLGNRLGKNYQKLP